ncbi:hypothetical protein [Okeania sp. SIO3B5]|nr:hypothetical protein [Okeania sp. SIO3B5]
MTFAEEGRRKKEKGRRKKAEGRRQKGILTPTLCLLPKGTRV